MIHDAAQRLTTEFGLKIYQRIEDRDGTTGYLLTDGEPSRPELFLLVAKEYSFKNLGSFMNHLVDGAVQTGATMIFFAGDDETFTVFDADFYQVVATPSTGKSKTRETAWLELTRDAGCALKDYLNGTSQPRTLAGDNNDLSSFA
jgi:hypothetical protein